MFFFFFEPESIFLTGQLCEIVENDPRHATMSNLFPDRIGDRVVITQIMGDAVWAYEDRPVTYRTNSRGRKVVEYDPKGVNSIYWFWQLKPVEQTKKNENWLNEWLKS